VFYVIDIPTPANTLASSPLETRLVVTAGIAREEWFMFPAGCVGLAHMVVEYQSRQVWPALPGTSLHWDDVMIHVEDRYPFEEEPFDVVIKTWNLDDTYDHTLTFAVVVDPAPPLGEMEDLEAALRDLGLWSEEI